MKVESHSPLTHQQMNSLHKETPALLAESLYYCSLDIFLQFKWMTSTSALNDPYITINASFYYGTLHTFTLPTTESMLMRGCHHTAQCLFPGCLDCPGYAVLHVLQGVRPSATQPTPFTVWCQYFQPLQGTAKGPEIWVGWRQSHGAAGILAALQFLCRGIHWLI